MRRVLSTLFVGLAVCAVAGCEITGSHHNLHISFGRHADVPFEWQGHLAEGQRIEIKGVNGGVSAEAATGDMFDMVEVTAERHGVRSDPNEVRIEVVEHAAGVTICAVYPAEGNSCEPGDEGRLRSRNNDVKVDFTVMVPAGVGFVGRTVNGGVKAIDLTGDVEARTVNGAITLSTGGHARAKTVNGSIRAEFGSADWEGEAAFETVNGSVTLTVPASIDADVRIRTTNGSIKTDLPITVTNSGRRRLDGTLGAGGRELRVRTTNGSVRLNPAD